MHYASSNSKILITIVDFIFISYYAHMQNILLLKKVRSFIWSYGCLV